MLFSLSMTVDRTLIIEDWFLITSVSNFQYSCDLSTFHNIAAGCGNIMLSSNSVLFVANNALIEIDEMCIHYTKKENNTFLIYCKLAI